MDNNEIAIILLFMLERAEEAILLVQGKHRPDLDKDRTLKLALTRLLEIISQSSNRVPIDFRMEYPAISWIQISAWRKRFINTNDSVDNDLLWYLLFYDLPELVQALEKILLKLVP